LIEKPPKLECADYPKIFSLTDRPRENRFSKSEDGWGEPLKYRSNGKSFRIDASKGYYLTAVSKMQRSGTHWNNSTSEKNN
jgi:hypothetical protein